MLTDILDIILYGNRVAMSSPRIRCSENITISDDVFIGSGCLIIETDSHPINAQYRINIDKPECSSMIKTAPIVINHRAWIGAQSIILKGVTIGEEAVIGAGSVVTKDIPPKCIAAGNPARVIRYL